MKERYGNEVPKVLRLLGAWRVNRDSVDFKWGYFAPRAGFELYLSRGTYFNRQYAINIVLGWGSLRVKLPFKTKLEEDCEMPRYGVAIHSGTFWVYLGGVGNGGSKWWTWDLPWFTYEFEGHKVQQASGKWVDCVHPWDSLDNRPADGRYIETHPYTYHLKSGVVQERKATIYKESRRWHRKWFPWLKLTRTAINIDFDDEVGERSGSWKGGTTGCGYDVIDGESMVTTLRRMERERKF